MFISFYEFYNKQPAEIRFFPYSETPGALQWEFTYFDMMNCAPKLFLGLCGRYSQAQGPVEPRGSLLRLRSSFPLGQVSSCFSCWFWKLAHWSCSSDPLMIHGKEHIPVEDEIFLSQFSIFQLPSLLITHPDDTAIKSIPHSIPSYPKSFSLNHH